MTLRPTSFLPERVRAVHDIVEYRYYLRDTRCRPKDLDYLIDLILSALADKRRFRQVDCLKVLKRIIKRLYLDRSLPQRTTDRIFALYRHYIFSHNEDAQWAASVMLKGRLLRDEQIQWLVEHSRESDHTLNRLLRYPKPHPVIRGWAEALFADPAARPDRRAEVLGLLITDSLPPIAADLDSRIVAWAIYYSRVSDDVRTRLLAEALTAEERLGHR